MDKAPTCPNDAAYRYTWPGRDESFICEQHAAGLRRVTEIMGSYVQLIPIEGDVPKCRQEVHDALAT
jgi:hypothetical protein